MKTRELRPCWQNCCAVDDDELTAIDAMEDSIAPLDQPFDMDLF
jgi:hypothetical protein